MFTLRVLLTRFVVTFFFVFMILLTIRAQKKLYSTTDVPVDRKTTVDDTDSAYSSTTELQDIPLQTGYIFNLHPSLITFIFALVMYLYILFFALIALIFLLFILGLCRKRNFAEYSGLLLSIHRLLVCVCLHVLQNAISLCFALRNKLIDCLQHRRCLRILNKRCSLVTLIDIR